MVLSLGMCHCSSSFILSLPVVKLRPSSENCRLRLGRIQHLIVSKIFVFPGKKFSFPSSKKIVSCLSSSSSSSSSLPNEEEVVLHQAVDDSLSSSLAEFSREGDLIRLVDNNDLQNNGSRGFKQTMTRSNLVAKQVISIQSALSLGFISQLWVDTTSVSPFGLKFITFSLLARDCFIALRFFRHSEIFCLSIFSGWF